MTQKLFWLTSISIALLIILAVEIRTVNATDYHIGTGQQYANLEALRSAVSTLDNDTLIFHDGIDTSLRGNYSPFYVRGTVNVISNVNGTKRTISQLSGNSNRIFDVYGTLNISSDIIIDGIHSSYSGTTAIYSGGIINAENVTFINNVSLSYGGAIDTYSGTRLVNVRGAYFANNTGGRGGGVEIYYTDAADFTDATFLNNTATSEPGGAIFITGYGNTTNIVMGATAGNISLYEGNKYTNPYENLDIYNSLHCTGSGTYNINIVTEGALKDNNETIIKDAGILDLKDPIFLREGYNYQVNITKTGEGIWKLGGDSQINTGSGQAAISIDQGQLFLYEDAELHMTGYNDSFTVKEGATVYFEGQNVIQGTSVLFSRNSMMTFNLSYYFPNDYSASAQNTETPMLHLSGNTLQVSGTRIDIAGLPNDDRRNGNYVLIQGTSPLEIGDFNLWIGNANIDVSGLVSERFGYSLGGKNNNTQLVLSISTTDNTVLRWNDSSSSGQWSVVGDNWTLIRDLSTDSFVPGDTVQFFGIGNHTIELLETVAIGHHTVTEKSTGQTWYGGNGDITGMHVSGNGNWTFNGNGSITDNDLTGSAALLFDGTGTLTLANSKANTYSGGTNLAGTGTLNILHGNLLGTGSINFLNNQTADQITNLHVIETTTINQQIIAENGSNGLVTVNNTKNLTISRTADVDETQNAAVYVKNGGQLTIEANPIGRYGNIILSENGTKNDSMPLEKGAAVYVENGGILNANKITVSKNKVQTGGGIIYNKGTATIQSATFTENIGSAVSAAGNSKTTIRDSTFTKNTSDGNGAAIYYEGSNGNNSSLTISATAGKTTTFSENIANRNVNGGTANSIYLTAINNGTANLIIETEKNTETGAEGIVNMLDPLSSDNGNYRINVTKTGEGTWKLAGDNKFEAAGGTTFQIVNGIVDLYKTDESNNIKAGNIEITNGTFEIGVAGRLNSYGGNTVKAQTIRLENGATLGFDLTYSISTDSTELTPSPALLNVNVGTLNVNGRQQIDLLALSQYKNGYGIFDLLTLNQTINTNTMDLLYHGEDITQFRQQFGKLKTTNNDKTLQVEILTTENGTVEWTNEKKNSQWDATSLNWEGQNVVGQYPLKGFKQFLHGDTVIFKDTGAGEITIIDGGVDIAEMIVNNSHVDENKNDYIFTGGPIRGKDDDDKGLLKQGSGTVTFTQENKFTGGTIIEGGKVIANKVSSLGTGNVEFKNNNTVLEFNLDGQSSGIFEQQISSQGNVGQLIKSGSGSLTLKNKSNEKNTYGEGTIILGGTLIAEGLNVFGSGNIITGIDNQYGTVILNLTQNETLTKTISGTGSFQTAGNGTLTLTQNNNYSGGTTIGNGTAIFAQNINSIGNGNIQNEGTLILDLASNGTLTQTMSGSGNLEKKGNGLLELAQANTFYGKTILSAGTLRLMNELSLQNSLLDYQNGNLDIGKLDKLTLGGIAGTQDLSLINQSGNSIDLTLNANNQENSQYSGTITGTGKVTKTGSGTQIFAGQNTYSGGTVISEGRLVSVGVSGFGTGNIVNNAEAEFQINGNNEETYEKSITGTGSLWKSGSGTLKLVGENVYHGDTIIENGQISVSSLDSLGYRPTEDDPPVNRSIFMRNENASLFLDLADDVTFEQNISGTGSIYKAGTGTLTFEKDLSYTGSTYVLAGTMFVNTEAQSVFTVYDGATLGGDGVVNNNVTFRNGSSQIIGQNESAKLTTFTAKNITYQNGSTIYIKVGMNASDQVVAKDGFDFAKGGGTVNVVLLNLGLDDFDPETTISPSEYTVFVSENGKLLLNGTHISNTESNSDTLTVENVNGEIRFLAAPEEGLGVLGYSVTTNEKAVRSLTLNLAAVSPAATAYLNTNQQSILRGIADASVFDGIYSYNKETRGAVIDQTIPMIQTAMPFLTQRSVTQFNIASFDRLRFLREPLALTDREINAYRGSSRRFAHIHSRNNYLWFQNYGDFIRMSAKEGVPEFQADSYGFSVGVDRGINYHSSVGLGMGGYFSDLNVNEVNQKGDIGSYLISLYGNWVNDDHWMITGSAGFVFSSYELTRNASTFNTTLNSRHSGTTLFASAEGSRKFLFGKYEVSPYLGADLIWLCEEGYSERAITGLSSLALNVKSQDTFTVLSTVGVRLGRSMRLLGGNIVNPSLYAAWIHDWTESDITTTASFFGEPSFKIHGASMNRDRAQLGANLNMTLNKRTDMFTRFNAELATRYSNLSFHLGIRFGF
ncbi:MAG: autotransporter domain-containing protein [Planctomycetaceae bacterium]|jgi:autotransporter-associated beta strand protein|nr:autotransporter domain-containing protein [Planctomycetaceae bacterium]